jgi:hypothetical protein
MSEPGFIGLKDYPDLPTTWTQDFFIFFRVSSCRPLVFLARIFAMEAPAHQ